MAARDTMLAINPLVLDAFDREARVFSSRYGVNEEGQLVGDVDHAAGRCLTDGESDIAVFALNNWQAISAALRIAAGTQA